MANMADEPTNVPATLLSGGATEAGKAPEATATIAPSTDATKTTETKAPEAVKPVIPDKYELKLPDGTQLTDATFAHTTALARELGITDSAKAQKLVDMQHGALAAWHKNTAEAHTRQVQTWQDEVRNDPVLGGVNLDATVNHAKTALSRFDSNGTFRALLDKSGYGNNPDVVRIFATIGKAMAEDSFVNGKQTTQKRSPEQVLYGNG